MTYQEARIPNWICLGAWALTTFPKFGLNSEHDVFPAQYVSTSMNWVSLNALMMSALICRWRVAPKLRFLEIDKSH